MFSVDMVFYSCTNLPTNALVLVVEYSSSSWLADSKAVAGIGERGTSCGIDDAVGGLNDVGLAVARVPLEPGTYIGAGRVIR